MSQSNHPRAPLRRLTTAALLTAAGFVLSYIEAILPFSIGIPGVKLGLCHIITLISLYRLTVWETAAVTAVRVSLTTLLFGNAASLAYSAAGAAVSLLVMLAARRMTVHTTRRIPRRKQTTERPATSAFSPIGISLLGGVTHNLAQLATAAVLMQTPGILTYLPVLLLAGTVTGVVIGLTAAAVLRRLPHT